LYAHILNGPKWSEILDKFLKTSDHLFDVLAFLFAQLYYENSQKGQTLCDSQDEMDQLRQQNVKLKMQLKSSSNQLDMKTKELSSKLSLKGFFEK